MQGAKQIEMWKIDELIPYEKNPRRHSDKQVKQIAASITEFGFNNPILVTDKKGIIAGHGRLMAARLLGLVEVPVIPLDHMNASQIKAYVIADSRLTELGDWDETDLGEIIIQLESEEYEHIGLTGFSDRELADLTDPLRGGEPKDPDPIDPPADPTAKQGQIWILGDHRIMCGDSTNPADVAKLMDGQAAGMCFTDPPYNIDYEGKTSEKLKIQSDNMSPTEYKAFCKAIADNIAKATRGCVYVCGPSGPEGRILFVEMDLAMHCSTVIVWSKDVFTLGRGKYQNQYEPIWFGWPADASGTRFSRSRKLSNVWSIPRPKASREHPTMKPVDLVATAIEHASIQNDIVLDLFSGSGSTILAAERTGRRRFTMEIDPSYVDVSIRRWEDASGGTARLT